MDAARRLGLPGRRACAGSSRRAPCSASRSSSMDFLDGAATGRDDRSMPAALADDFVRRLAALHQHRLGVAARPADASGVDATHRRRSSGGTAVYRAETDVAIPLLEEGAAWLHHHAPTVRAGRRSCTAIPGPGNFVHDGSRVIAFTDWEFAHLGDPTEDWAYLISMRGASHDAPRRLAGAVRTRRRRRP